MNRIKTLMLLLSVCMTTVMAQTKVWVDVTDQYIVNPRYDGNDRSGWEGTTLGAANPKENAEHYSKNYDTYQTLRGLPPGQYRLSLNAFYRMGSAWEDYNAYYSGDAESTQYAKLYARSSEGEQTVAICCASSGKTTNNIGGSTSRVGWNEYIPNNMEAAYYWFQAGYYKNTLTCNVGSDGILTIGIKKDQTINGDWTCIDNWQLRYYATLVKATSLTLDKSTMTLVRGETGHINATIQPNNVTYTVLNWTSSNTSVATVDANGNVKALAAGTAVITATTKDGSNISARCTLRVNNPAAPTANNIVINEIMASNIDVYRDPSTNFGPWVELYNPTDETVDLGGLYVTDDASNLRKHRLVNDYGFLPAHGYAILNFDHREVFTQRAWRQIDDKLDVEGGTIILSDGNNIIVQQDYPAAISRTSYARTVDGGAEWGTTANPTPQATNNGCGGYATTRLDDPVVTPDGQLFSGSLSVTVSIPSGATLRYTTDGSTPTLTNGMTSTTGSFTVNKTRCYRFRLYKDGYLPSRVITRSYIYNNGNEPFPVISVVTDRSSLFDTDYAIFAYSDYGRTGNGQAANYNANMDWDRPVNFEYITTDNACLVNQECNLSACGGWSRGWNPHSFKLKAGKEYDGMNSFDAQFFTEKPYLKHKVLQIRNGGNDTGCRVKDAAMQQIVARSGLYVEYQSWQPVHVYVNGNAYAVLNMREPNNKHFAQTNYGIDTDLIDQFEICPDSGYVQKAGTPDAFNRWYTLSANAADNATYGEIEKLVDIDEYVNYMATELYIGSVDWPQNNVKGFRSTEDGRFRFVLFDLDASLGTNVPLTMFFNKQNYTFDRLYGYDWSQNKSIDNTRQKKEIKFVTIFRNMLKNDAFRKKFIDAFCLIGGSVYTPERVEYIVNDVSTKLALGGYVNPYNTAQNIINTMNASRQKTLISHLKSVSDMKLSKVEAKTVTLKSNIEGAAILLNGMEVPTGKFDGQLFAPITLEAKAPVGYKFMGWKDAKAASSAEYVSTSRQYTMPATGAQELIAVWDVDDDATRLAHAVPVKINEVSPANDMYVNEYMKKDDWVELYNTTDADIDASGLYLSDNPAKPKKYQITAEEGVNTIIPAHGHLVVWCSKRMSFNQLHASFKLSNDDGQQVLLTAGSDFVKANGTLYAAYPDTPREFTDVLTYNTTAADNTVGRYPDGSNAYYVMRHATIGKANSMQESDTYVAADYLDEVAYILGDVNGDGKVTLADANLVMNYYLGTLDKSEKFNEKAADVNGDGIITIADANDIVNIYLSK